MHPLHDYVAKQLADKLKDRRIVVWYDERGEFRPFVDEVRGGHRAASEPVPAAVVGTKASLAEYAGSLFELRAVVEPLVSGDKPDALVVSRARARREGPSKGGLGLERRYFTGTTVVSVQPRTTVMFAPVCDAVTSSHAFGQRWMVVGAVGLS
jgi:hypothetical protein